jgi:hypothetical protein
MWQTKAITTCCWLVEIYFEGTILGKVIGFTTRIINPDRLIDKFTEKKAYLKILL